MPWAQVKGLETFMPLHSPGPIGPSGSIALSPLPSAHAIASYIIVIPIGRLQAAAQNNSEV
jgi:hypothetical protein